MNTVKLKWCLYLLSLLCLDFGLAQEGTIQTVQGPIKVSELGFVLTHEHIMSNYGKPQDSTSFYNDAALLGQVVPYLKKLRRLGVDAIFDCTTAYFGRRTDLLQKISRETDINIITNTGFYAAANDRYIPSFAYEMEAAEIADLWVDEFENGIGGSDIKPGFIKLAFDMGTPSPIDTKLFEAGVRAHLKTGLTLVVHTGDNREAAKLQMQLLKGYKVDPSAWIWVHANKAKDDALLLDTAKKGAWISFDGVSSSNYKEYADRIEKFRKNGLLERLLLSHDGNGFPAGGPVRGFDALVKYLVPELLYRGIPQSEIDLITKENPKKAFLPGVKHSRP
ncbi:phosphotriesterase family protein [Pseudozobellia thermophila]|uniref:Phosphotriesterase-related protein n=1 Tax=Pseudozobellia thermophila TaxID=192903 RepID=A0A1M6LZQ4_9FLAO|nr:hypothetical protein [Pseudozobellia thermophila]SHJ76645.1 phosphotriesterase-related protein [Pseudozobellia thermophila]